jgi:hypothetical protein
MAVGSAYIDYALTHRPQFQLMFRSDAVQLEDETYMRCARSAFQHLLETMAPLLEPAINDEERKWKVMLAWSTVHGFVTLALEQGFTYFYGRKKGTPISSDGRAILEILTGSLFRRTEPSVCHLIREVIQ